MNYIVKVRVRAIVSVAFCNISFVNRWQRFYLKGTWSCIFKNADMWNLVSFSLFEKQLNIQVLTSFSFLFFFCLFVIVLQDWMLRLVCLTLFLAPLIWFVRNFSIFFACFLFLSCFLVNLVLLVRWFFRESIVYLEWNLGLRNSVRLGHIIRFERIIYGCDNCIRCLEGQGFGLWTLATYCFVDKKVMSTSSRSAKV